MTEFTVKQMGNRFEITCKNHAISDVCRGVSALIFALVNKLRFDDEYGKIKRVDIKLSSGDAEISLEYKNSFIPEGVAVLETVVLGMRAIKEAHPEELEISVNRKCK